MCLQFTNKLTNHCVQIAIKRLFVWYEQGNLLAGEQVVSGDLCDGVWRSEGRRCEGSSASPLVAHYRQSVTTETEKTSWESQLRCTQTATAFATITSINIFPREAGQTCINTSYRYICRRKMVYNVIMYNVGSTEYLNWCCWIKNMQIRHRVTTLQEPFQVLHPD